MHKDLERNNHYLGKRYGKLVILEIVYTQDKKRLRRDVRCKCDCGNEKIIRLSNLIEGRTISCGCYNIEKGRKAPGESGHNSLYIQYRKHAKDRNIEFHLTKEEFKSLVIQNCHYCNIEPKQKFYGYARGLKSAQEHTSILYNGIDRIDSAKDYTIDNVVPCCGMCNKLKMEKTYEEYVQWILKAAEFLKSKLK